MIDVKSHPIYRAVRSGLLEIRQLALLMAVVREPGLSVRDYALRIGLPKPIVSRASSALAEAKLVSDGKDNLDLRLRILLPTDRGRTLITDIVGQEILENVCPQPDRPAPSRRSAYRRAVAQRRAGGI